MSKTDFEGSFVLEKLAEINKVEEFLLAVDSDNFSRARQLMKQAGLDSATIALVLEKMEDV